MHVSTYYMEINFSMMTSSPFLGSLLKTTRRFTCIIYLKLGANRIFTHFIIKLYTRNWIKNQIYCNEKVEAINWKLPIEFENYIPFNQLYLEANSSVWLFLLSNSCWNFVQLRWLWWSKFSSGITVWGDRFWGFLYFRLRNILGNPSVDFLAPTGPILERSCNLSEVYRKFQLWKKFWNYHSQKL